MWYYQNLPIRSLQDIPGNQPYIGFCYKITNLATGRIYIGKKNLFRSRSKMPRSKGAVCCSKESDWKRYYGSSKELSQDLKELGASNFHREILGFARTKKYLGYLEAKHQMCFNVLEDGQYNANILGRYFPRDLEAEFRSQGSLK